MVDVPLQTGTSLGRQLVFFLFLLVPGYLAVRAYYWANVALENDARVNRLVLMAIGGFVSLAVVALWRQLMPTVRVAPLAFLTPEWLVVDGVLSVQTISRLSVLESVNLIVSQGIVAVVGGYILGMVKYVWYDERNQTHSNLEHPWTQLTDEIPNEPIIVVSNDGTHTKGRPVALGSEQQDYDIMLVASGSDDDTETKGLPPATSTDDSLPRGAISYHQYDDISRVVMPGSLELTDNRTILQRRHLLLAQDLTEHGMLAVMHRYASAVIAHISPDLPWLSEFKENLTASNSDSESGTGSDSDSDDSDDNEAPKLGLPNSDDE